MLAKKEELVSFSFRQHLFLSATNAKISLVRFGYIANGVN